MSNSALSPSEKVAVYGSLREGEYNFEAFNRFYPDQIEVYKTNIEIPSWELYSLGSYPGAVRGEGSIIVDILNVSPLVKQHFDGMELSAGYILDEESIEGEIVTIYRYGYPEVLGSKRFPKVVNGDWVNPKYEGHEMEV